MHNQLLGEKVPHPISTNFNDDFSNPPAKRLKRNDSMSSTDVSDDDSTPARTHSPPLTNRPEIPDSEDDGEDDNARPCAGQTQLETALPPIHTDTEAIEEYEAYKAGQAESSSLQDRLSNNIWTKGRSSIYVDAFNLALNTVLDDEGHLFDEAEMSFFRQWRELAYESQYLYVRLFLRKTSAWHRIGKLGYYQDIADLEAAVSDLQKERTLPRVEHEQHISPGELEIPEGTTLGETFKFAECSSDHITSLDEASILLLLDELKAIAKEAKVNGKNKKELLYNLRITSGKQGGLAFRGLRRSEREESAGSVIYDDEETDGVTTPSHKTNRDDLFTRKILSQTGKCIRLSLAPLKLFERVHLVFYRSTEWTEKSLTTLILAKISRRSFPEYVVSRSTTIFASRSLLLEFEASLRTQFRVDNILEFNGTPGRKAFEEVTAIFEAVYPRWKALLISEQQKEERVYESGEGAYLRRFSPAWVYTRIVHKALHPLARFKEHKREHEILSELLGQRLFHAARRGAWYQRKALLEEHYMHALTPGDGRTDEANKRHWKRMALRTCEEGLEDRECHVIYHYDLQKRIRKIEKGLRVPVREQHDFGHVSLGKAAERDVHGIKIEKDELCGTVKSGGRKGSEGEAKNEQNRRGGKTVWLDELDTNEHVSVEEMCLSYYRKELGWKGYHCEGRILGMLFGLLFSDILFAYVPNVFQTPYQTCPLDLHTDAFYAARISEINQRINEIGNGDAEPILRSTWDAHFERKTCIVGVRWEQYEFDDLIEIVRCFNGEALGTIMRVMSQEYAARGGGVPDLFLWRTNEESGKGRGEVMFSEVKSENDRLSDTQRLWISVLLNAGVRVELCHAVAREVRFEG
jgi:fanconi-associated nuclease 1